MQKLPHMQRDEIKIYNDFHITNTGLNFQGKQYTFNDIAEISFQTQVTKRKLFPNKNYYWFYLKLFNGESIKINGKFSFFDRKKMIDRLSEAYTFLSTNSFDSRMEFYTKNLKDKGFFIYSPLNIKIYNNGDIVSASKKLNLIKAAKEGKLLFGKEEKSSGKHHHSKDANQIVISETKGTFISRKNKIVFDFSINRDVIFSLLKKIAYSDKNIDEMLLENVNFID
jgi:hypothetical protein